jgi:hypothetical protein
MHNKQKELWQLLQLIGLACLTSRRPQFKLQLRISSASAEE